MDMPTEFKGTIYFHWDEKMRILYPSTLATSTAEASVCVGSAEVGPVKLRNPPLDGIAADLYEALDYMVNLCQETHISGYGMDQARAALSKARGKS